METVWSCSFLNVHFVYLFHILLCGSLSPALWVPREADLQQGKLLSLMTANDLPSAHTLLLRTCYILPGTFPAPILIGKGFTVNFYNLCHRCSLVCLTEFLPLTHQTLWCLLFLICAILETDLILLLSVPCCQASFCAFSNHLW